MTFLSISKRISLGALLLASTLLQAQSAPSQANKERLLDGVWELESMGVIDSNGHESPWCEGSFGVIIYTNGYMSTAVNCTSDQSKSVLYSGPFEIQGQAYFTTPKTTASQS